MKNALISLLSLLVLAAFGCNGPAPQTLRLTPEGTGPALSYSPLEKPDAISFFPSDLATRYDPTSPTRKRLNISLERDLEVSKHLREQLNRLDGFSVVSPISIPFDAPLDLSTVKDGGIRLFNVSPESEGYGEEVSLDLQGTHYPTEFKPREVFPYDEFAALPDLFFGWDNGEDEERVINYEVATNTLLVRPLYPLREKTTYGIVITEEIRGENGNPIRSPFPAVHHASDYRALSPLQNWIDPETIAFAWSFTTRSITNTPISIRDGLDGKGSLGWLQEKYPGRWIDFQDLDVADTPQDPDDKDHPYILDGEFLPKALSSIGAIAGGGLDTITFEHVDYAVFGHFESVDLRGEDGTIWVKPLEGTTAHKASKVGFLLTVPKNTEAHSAPFPVLLYNHGSRTSRLEQILMANDFSRAGIAVMSIDAVGHGPFGGDLRSLVEREAANVPPDLASVVAGVIAQSFLSSDYEYADKDLMSILDDLEENGLWQALFVQGRATDDDGDGVLLSGDSYYVPNPFQLASNGFQTVIDNMVLVRLLESLSPDSIPGEGFEDPSTASEQELLPYMMAGDFNADGVLDVGGKDVKYFTMGTSMGAFHSTILLPLEKRITTGISNVGGGGLVDIMLRSSLAEVIDSIMVEPLGPVIVGCPVPKEDESAPTEVALSWNNWALKCRDIFTIQFAEKSSLLPRIPVTPKGTVTLSNPKLAQSTEHSTRTVVIHEDGGFSIAVGADKGDSLLFELRDEAGDSLVSETFVAQQSGSGHQRNSPRFRRLVATAQAGLDTMDPLAWARYILREPIENGPAKNILHFADVGDVTVPFSTMLAWDRGVGLLGLEEKASAEVMGYFLQENRMLGGSWMWDFDNLEGGSDGPGPLPVIETESGVSGVRFPFTSDHEFLGTLKPDAPFDWAQYYRNQAIHYLRTDGGEIRDDLCMEDNTCSWLPSPSLPSEEETP